MRYSDEPKKQNPIVHNALMLGIFCIVAGLCLGVAYEATKTTISDKKESVTLSAFESVFGKEGLTLKELEIEDSFEQKASIEKVICAEGYGYAVEIIGKGYKGDPMEIVVGVSIADNKVCGVQIVSHSETAGLGANATKPSFVNQFIGVDALDTIFKVVKTDSEEPNEIDALGGATKTSKGVVDAVNLALQYMNAYLLKGEDK